MSEKLVDTTEKMILRGNILRICEAAEPLGAGQEIILGALKREGFPASAADVRKACEYMQGKGLLELKEIRNDVLNIHRTLAKITPLGIDVLEGNAAADGVQL